MAWVIGPKVWLPALNEGRKPILVATVPRSAREGDPARVILYHSSRDRVNQLKLNEFLEVVAKPI